MEKKDYLNLKDKYSHLKDYEERYRRDLLAFIHEAFDKHDGAFEIKPEGCDTWEKRSKCLDFFPMDELPYYLIIGVEDDNSHEIHISRIRITETLKDYWTIEVDGWDWSECRFVERLDMYYDIDSLSTIADFINAVLEQEHQTE